MWNDSVPMILYVIGKYWCMLSAVLSTRRVERCLPVCSLYTPRDALQLHQNISLSLSGLPSDLCSERYNLDTARSVGSSDSAADFC